MNDHDRVEAIIARVLTLTHAELVEQLLYFPAPFKVDFTPDYLVAQSTDRLRHLLVAMSLHCRRMPQVAVAA
jgi:hypothetical protein